MKYLLTLLPLLGSACSAPQLVRESPLTAGSRACIDLTQVTGQLVERDGIIYHLSSGETFRNDLGGHCPPLENATGGEITQTENNGTQLCRGDSVRVYDPATVGAGGPGAVLRCQAAAFIPVTAG